MKPTLRVPAAAALLFLVACAELAPPREGAAYEFELDGRIAVRFSGEAASGNIAWRHAVDADELLITSSLGQGVARLVRDRAACIVTTAQGREYRGDDAEVLTEQVLGYRIPLAGLSSWVRARTHPAAGEAIVQRGTDGRIRTIEQDGWRIEYLGWQTDTPDSLPNRLHLTYPGIELRLAIGRWRTMAP